MREQIEKYLSNYYDLNFREAKYKSAILKVYVHQKVEAINKSYCIYYFPDLTPELAQEIFNDSFKPVSPNDIISLGIGICGNEIYFSNFFLLEFKKTVKSIDKLTSSYRKKIEYALSTPFHPEKLNPLFDRKEVIEDFYKLYKKTKEFLLEKGRVTGQTEESKPEFIDQLLLTFLILYFLQERNFLDRNKKYLIEHFTEEMLQNPKGNNYFEWIQGLFKELMKDSSDSISKTKKFGELAILGPAPFLFDWNGSMLDLSTITIENQCFYHPDLTRKAILLEPKKLSDSLPILNLLESRDWVEGNIDEFVIGAIFEKLIHSDDRKETGSFYTPEELTSFMSDTTIEKYVEQKFSHRQECLCYYNAVEQAFLPVAINKKGFLGQNDAGHRQECLCYYNAVEQAFLPVAINKKGLLGQNDAGHRQECLCYYQIIQNANEKELIALFDLVSHLKICDPAVGSAHFLESAIETIVRLYKEIWLRACQLKLKKKFYIQTGNEVGEIIQIDITDLEPDKHLEKFQLYIKFFIILSRNIYGVDITARAIKVAKARLFLTMAKHFDLENNTYIRFPNVHFNLRVGNSLAGYRTLEEPENTKKKDVLSHDLFSFVSKEMNPIQKTLDKLSSKEKENISNLAKALGQKKPILPELNELGDLLSNKKMTVDEFHRALEIKSHLSQIHIASLSTSLAKTLQSLLEMIRELFHRKLEERFIQENNLSQNIILTLKDGKSFHWEMEFPEVFPRVNGKLTKESGFDIFLGNPPYIQLQKMKEGADLYEKLGYKTFVRTGDIYCLFYELVTILLKDGGYSSLLTSNSWMKTKYGLPLRKYLLENTNILELLNFEDAQVFDAAIVEPNILFWKKKKTVEQAFLPVSENKAGSNKFYSKSEFLITRRNLPHWELKGAYYFITFTTKNHIVLSKDEQEVVYTHILEGNGKFYYLVCLAVMPDHVHLILSLNDGYSLSRVMKGIKGVSANKINKLNNNSGSIWMDESYDRIIRDENELYEKIVYIFNNPIKEDLSIDTSNYNRWYINSTSPISVEQTHNRKPSDDAGHRQECPTYYNAVEQAFLPVAINKKGLLGQNAAGHRQECPCYQNTYAATIGKDYQLGMDLRQYFQTHKILMGDLGTDQWSVGTNAGNNIKTKIESSSILLKDLDIKIYRGITTGFNDAFIIDGATKDELIQKDKRNVEIIKPILRGRDIQRYSYEFADQWIINSHNGVKDKKIKPVDVRKDYPEIFKYLSKTEFHPMIKDRLDQGEDWTNLRNCAYLEDFDKPKIVWSLISDEAKFSYDNNSHYLLNTTFFLTGKHLKFLLSLFNSKIIKWYYSLISTSSGMGTGVWNKLKIEQLPIPKAPIENPELQKPLIALVDQILSIKEKDPKATTVGLEQQIDSIVFKLYGLTEEEIGVTCN